MIGEAGGGEDESSETDDTTHPFKPATGGLTRLCEEVEAAQPSCGVSVFNGDLAVDAPVEAKFAVPHRQLSGNEEQRIREYPRHVSSGGSRRLRQLDRKLVKPIFDLRGSQEHGPFLI
jgi:hypothetical protein